MSDSDLNARAAVVVVSMRGGDDLKACLRSLDAQHLAPDEIVLVSNGLPEAERRALAAAHDRLTILHETANTGFAPAVNKAARHATAPIIALINDDAVAEPTWLAELVRPLREGACEVAGGVVRDAAGERVEFAGGHMAFYGHGFAAHNGDPAGSEPDTVQATLFVSGSNMAVKREWWEARGGFTEDFFAFFEDVDFGWRTWIAGGTVQLIPSAIIHHRHHATIEQFGTARERYLLERNALRMLWVNFGDGLRDKAFAAAVTLATLRGAQWDDTDLGDYSLTADGAADGPPTPHVGPQVGAGLAAIRDVARELETLNKRRAVVQASRKVADRDIMPLLVRPLTPNVPHPDFLLAFDGLTKGLGLADAFTPARRVLIVTGDTIADKMAGPAIRAWEMAKMLAPEHEVKLMSMRKPERAADGFTVGHITAATAGSLARWADVVVVQGFGLYLFPELAEHGANVVVDIYDPFHVEAIVMRKDEIPQHRWATAASDRDVINTQLEAADLLLCASEKQRDFWLGHLASLGRINPATYDEDPDLRSLLDIAPFGLPSTPPQQTRRAIRDAGWGIKDDDVVLLWGGGIYNWFDPATLIRGFAAAREKRPELKLVFMGTAHPNPDVPEMERVVEARRIADELDLSGKHVFFNDGWVAYDDRVNYLMDADIGVSTHFLHLETALSFRTRILDYLWAGLPVLSTEGDSLSAVIREHDLGIAVPAEDPDAIADALVRLADKQERDRLRSRIEMFREHYTWERALRPLVEFCRSPRTAPDRAAVESGRRSAQRPILSRRPLRQRLRTFETLRRDKGVSTALRMGLVSMRTRRDARRARV